MLSKDSLVVKVEEKLNECRNAGLIVTLIEMHPNFYVNFVKELGVPIDFISMQTYRGYAVTVNAEILETKGVKIHKVIP